MDMSGQMSLYVAMNLRSKDLLAVKATKPTVINNKPITLLNLGPRLSCCLCSEFVVLCFFDKGKLGLKHFLNSHSVLRSLT